MPVGVRDLCHRLAPPGGVQLRRVRRISNKEVPARQSLPRIIRGALPSSFLVAAYMEDGNGASRYHHLRDIQ